MQGLVPLQVLLETRSGSYAECALCLKIVAGSGVAGSGC